MNTSLTSLQRLAAQKNNEAVLQLSAGVMVDAIKNFTLALNISRQCMGDDHGDETEQEGSAVSLDQYMACSEEIPSLESQDSDCCYVHRQGIPIPLDAASGYYSCVMMSSVIIYNLALAQQLSCSSPDTRRNPAKLIKAARLYDLAFNMQRNDENLGDNVCFTLAIVNNLGVVYRELGDLEAARKCFEHVLSTLMLVLDCGKSYPQFGHYFQNATSFNSIAIFAPAA